MIYRSIWTLLRSCGPSKVATERYKIFFRDYCSLGGGVAKTYKFKSKFDNESIQKYVQTLVRQYENFLRGNVRQNQLRFHRLDVLEQLSKNVFESQRIQNEIKDLEILATDVLIGEEMLLLAKEDLNNCRKQLENLDRQIIDLLVPNEEGDESDVILEITAGVGGQEAMLFADTIYQMYYGFANYKKWIIENCIVDKTELGGIRHANLTIKGDSVYGTLKYEGGVHRVQRIPKTEKSGRIHTSTVAVAVMPQPNDIAIQISPNDLKIETKRASGAGGQHVNTTDSAVRITHLPTGLVVECQKERSQLQNKKEATNKLRAIVYEKKLEQQFESYRSSRKLQIGTSSRSEKIRTYNYVQDRVTDHRINLTLHDLPAVLEGKDHFEQILLSVREYSKYELLEAMIDDVMKKD